VSSAVLQKFLMLLNLHALSRILPNIEQMFSSMVDYTEPICMDINATLASTITVDTTGIELYVK
jgi:hypothetical protein